jgi:hypothetical protein
MMTISTFSCALFIVLELALSYAIDVFSAPAIIVTCCKQFSHHHSWPSHNGTGAQETQHLEKVAFHPSIK